MKVFISVPMHGRSEDGAWEDIKKAFDNIPKIFPNQKKLIITHNLCTVGYADSGRLFYLGSAIQAIDRCDAVYFCPGWEKAKECQAEHYICELYGIQRIEA